MIFISIKLWFTVILKFRVKNLGALVMIKSRLKGKRAQVILWIPWAPYILTFTHFTFYRGMDQKLPRRRRDPEQQVVSEGEKKGSQQMKPPVERKSPKLPGSKKNNSRLNRNQKIKRNIKVINSSILTTFIAIKIFFIHLLAARPGNKPVRDCHKNYDDQRGK